jgi:predicted secreted protein
MNRPLLLTAAGLALLAPAAYARTIVVTDANNEKSVILNRGDTLLVVLDANGAAGYTWHVVYDPNGPLLLSSKHIYPASFGNKGIGSANREELRFTVSRSVAFGRVGYLNLLRMRNEPGVGGGYLWHISYTIKAAT